MLTNETLVDFACRKSIASMTYLVLLSVILLPLSGCTGGDGDAGPIVSSLETPTDTTTDSTDSADPADSASDSSPDDLNLAAEEPIDLASDESEGNASADLPPDSNVSSSEQEEDSIASLVAAPQDNPAISMAPTPTGATASLTWQSIPDPKVKGYYVYYGKQSSSDPGVCSYEDRIAADAPPVTIAELEPNTPYFFAVSAFSNLESPCSNEVTAITPPAGT